MYRLPGLSLRAATFVVELAVQHFVDWDAPAGRLKALAVVAALRLTLCRLRRNATYQDRHNEAIKAGQRAAPSRTTEATTGTALLPCGGAPEAIKAALGRLQQRLLPAEPEAREAVAGYITEFAAELGDRAPLKSSITRAVHLYQQSSRSLIMFLDRLHQARATVRERITAPTSKPITNRMSYFFRVLEDDLGLTPAEHTPEPSATNAADEMTRPTPPHTDTVIETAGGG